MTLAHKKWRLTHNAGNWKSLSSGEQYSEQFLPAVIGAEEREAFLYGYTQYYCC